MADESVYGITEKKCPVCGKIFIPAPLHVYKRNYGRVGRTKYLCSYHCMLAYDKEHPPKRGYTKNGSMR